MKKLNKIVLIALIVVICVGCDQVTKDIAQARLSLRQPFSMLGGIFRFQYSENSGAMLGLGSNLSPELRFWILVVFSSLMLVGMTWFVWRSKEMNALGIIGSALVLGGGLSNLLDRMLNEGVGVDFVRMGIGPLRTGIFNLADTFICMGAPLLLLYFSRQDQKPPEKAT